MAKILKDSPEEIARAGKLLAAGTIVAIPTETVYGLAANAFDEAAVRKIFEAKGRPFIDPLIVHVLSLEAAGTLAEIENPAVKILAKKFCPGPLTFILPKKNAVPEIVTAGEKTVAIRIPRHEIARKILAAAKVPLAAPSANPFGYVSPTSAEHVENSLGKKIEFIVDGGNCECGIESTIVFCGEREVKILRLGVITKEEISEALGGVPVVFAKGILENLAEQNGVPAKAQIAPGMLKKHYSPNAEIRLGNSVSAEFPKFFEELSRAFPSKDFAEKVAVVFQKRPENFSEISKLGVPAKNVFWLSESGSAADAARTIFALLRNLDAAGFEKIFIEKAENFGIGAAVNDRLSRAAAK